MVLLGDITYLSSVYRGKYERKIGVYRADESRGAGRSVRDGEPCPGDRGKG